MPLYAYDLVQHIYEARAWSEATFGPGDRWQGVVAHVRKELLEIEAKPDDPEEWIDVMILAIDGLWRKGYGPERICEMLAAKMEKNRMRDWPDWRNVPAGQPIEHVRGEGEPMSMQFDRDKIVLRMEKRGLPCGMVDGVWYWLQFGFPPGGFLWAVLTSNLFEAVRYGDEDNLAALVDWVKYVHNEFPSGAHGSVATCNAWSEAQSANRKPREDK